MRPSGLLCVFALAACPFAARAVDVSLKFEPGLALSTGKPQSQRFGLGAATSLKGLVGFEGGYVNFTGGLTFLGLPSKTGFASSTMGTAWAPSAGLRIQLPRESEGMRLRRPHQNESFKGAKPWLDGDLLYVRTGGLDRVGFSTAVGLSFPVGESRSFWLGPFVRYLQILQGGRTGFDTRDASALIVGISLEAGTRLLQPSSVGESAQNCAVGAAEAPAAVVAPALAPVVVPAPAPGAPSDRDGDGVPDDFDDCPDMPGPASNGGCPVFEKIVVKPDKFELKEQIQFAKNEGLIDPVSYPALDEIAKALHDNPNFHLSIEGHASSEGGDEHNQNLSSQRAAAVLEYLASRGVSRERLVFKGFSSSRPVESNSTESGRVANRRVEFILHFLIEKEGKVP
jgi:outer membrane protein OmpA-like peptidoglycan-associated protein